MLQSIGWRTGVARAPAHHGEILQGVFAEQGRLLRGLVTMPCPMYETRATFVPGPGAPLTVTPARKTKALRAAELALTACVLYGGARVGGRLEIEDNAPECRGFGSSTSDVLAAVLAVADAFDVALPPSAVARLAVQAESASDSLMYEDSTVLFAHRDGVLIEDFGRPLPALRVLGFGTGLGDGRGVNTLALPPARYTPREIGLFAELRELLRSALEHQDAGMLGAVATASTELNQRHLPIPDLDRIRAVAAEVGAAGIQTAHSGDIAGLMFDAGLPDVEARIDAAQEALAEIGVTEQWQFTTTTRNEVCNAS